MVSKGALNAGGGFICPAVTGLALGGSEVEGIGLGPTGKPLGNAGGAILGAAGTAGTAASAAGATRAAPKSWRGSPPWANHLSRSAVLYRSSSMKSS